MRLEDILELIQDTTSPETVDAGLIEASTGRLSDAAEEQSGIKTTLMVTQCFSMTAKELYTLLYLTMSKVRGAPAGPVRNFKSPALTGDGG